jgi:type VI secretion system protein ImpE
MKKIDALIKQADLSTATSLASQALRDDPLNADIRGRYIELLCVQGDLDKADQQLDIMLRQHPDFVTGAVNLRHLIRAASARKDFYQAGMTAQLFDQPDAMFKAQLSLRVALNDADIPTAVSAATELESLRQSVTLNINGQPYQTVRDLDDSLCGYLELFGTDGHFYLVRFEQIDSLQFKKPESLLDTVWRRAEIFIKEGPQGDVFVPMTYIDSNSVDTCLGRGSDWHQYAEGLVTGIGQKMLLINDDAMALTDIHSMSVNETVDAVVNQ